MEDNQLCNERHKRIDARLEELEKCVKEFGEVVVAIKELAVETKYMREDLNNTTGRVNKIESKDSDKWDKFKWLIVAALMSSIVGAGIGYAIALGGML